MSANASNHKEKLARNSLFSVIAWLSPIVIGFVVTPVLVTSLGVEQYGILAIIYGFLSYSFTFSIGKVAAKFIPEFRATGQHDRVSELVSATLWFSLLIAVVGAGAIGLSARYIVADVLLLPAETQSAAVLALQIACLTGLVMMVNQTFQYVVQGLHGFGSYLLLTNISGVMLGAGNIVLALSGYGLVGLLIWNFATILVTGLLFFFRSKQLLGSLSLTINIDRSIVSSVVTYGGNIILFQIFSNVLYIFERAWVTRKFGPDGLTFYAVPMVLAIYIHGIAASFVQALFPHLNELLADRERLRSLYQKASKIVLATAAIGCTTYVVAGSAFLSVWLTPDLADRSYDLLVTHSLTFALLAMMIIPLQVAEAFRFSSLTAIVMCLWMVIAIPLMIVGADILEIQGVAMARLVVVAVITFPLIFYVESKFLGAVFWEFWTFALIRVIVAVAATGFVGYHLFGVFSYNWLSVASGVVVCGLLFSGILLLTGYFSKNERDIVRELIINRRMTGFDEKV